MALHCGNYKRKVIPERTLSLFLISLIWALSILLDIAKKTDFTDPLYFVLQKIHKMKR